MHTSLHLHHVSRYKQCLHDSGNQPVHNSLLTGTLQRDSRCDLLCISSILQVFFLLKESELTPSGANLLDGRYSVFGYVTNGQDNLGNMKVSSHTCALLGWSTMLMLCMLQKPCSAAHANQVVACRPARSDFDTPDTAWSELSR